MTRLAAHGGCNWYGCTECFPSRPKSRQVTTAALSVPASPAIRMTVLDWSAPYETAIPGYTKVSNVYGIVYVVETSRLTDFRTY